MREPSAAQTIFRFDGFAVEVGRGLSTESGGRLKLQPQPLRVLEHLLLRAPAIVSREELREAVWPDVHVDFDQSLNFCIRQIRAVLNDSATTPRYIETLPKQGYRFIGMVTASVGGLVGGLDGEQAGPVGETAAAVEAPAPVAVLKTPARGFGRFRRVFGLIAAVGVVTGLLALARHRQAAGRLPAPIRSLAVLPIENFSGEAAQEYLADGLTDELTTMLAKNSSLRIISHTSVMRFQHARQSLPGIARELGADAILEGSLTRSGSALHITLQLIEGSTDTHLWAESYDRSPGDSVSVSREAALAIAQRTHSALPVASPPRYVSPEAHDAYLRGRYLWFSELNQQAGEEFERAVRLQPDYALGWSGLASYYGAGTVEQQQELDPRVALPLSEEAARKALALDETLADAHLSLGAAIYFGHWDWGGAQRELDRALELDPRLFEALHFRAKILSSLNRYDEAITAERQANEMDPFARPWATGFMLMLARRYDAALRDLLEKERVDPANVNIAEVLMDTYAGMGRHQEYAKTFSSWLELTGRPGAAAEVKSAWKEGGYPAVLAWRLRDLAARAKTHYVSPVEFANVEAALGHRDRTLSYLDAGLEQHSPFLLGIQNDPVYDFLHADRHYRAVIARTGLPPAY